MSGGGGDQTVTQVQQVPEFERRARQNLTGAAQNQFQGFSPQPFPDSRVAPISDYTQQAVAGLANVPNSPLTQETFGRQRQLQQFLGNAAGSPNPATQAGGQVVSQLPQTANFAQQAAANAFQQQPGQSTQGGFQDTVQSIAQQQAGREAGASAQGGIFDAAQMLSLQPFQQTPGQGPTTDALVQNVLSDQALNFQRNILPQIEQQQVSGNTYGGTRGALAEGIAAGEADRTAALTASQLRENAVARDLQNRQAMLGLGLNAGQAQEQAIGRDQSFLTALTGQGLQGEQIEQNAIGRDLQNQQALLGQALNAGQIGSNVLSQGMGSQLDAARLQGVLLPQSLQMQSQALQPLLAAGDIDRQYRQQLLDDQVQRFNQIQQQPVLDLQNYANVISGIPSSGQTQQTTQPGPETGGFAGALGGAATGAGIVGSLAEAGLSMSNPVMGGIVGLGALAGLF